MNGERFKYIKKPLKQALTFITAEGMHDLLKAKQFKTFAEMHSTLCMLLEDDYRLSEDQEHAACVAFELFGPDTGEMLATFRERGDAKVSSNITPNRKERDVLAIVDKEAFELYRDDDDTRNGIYRSLKTLSVTHQLTPGQIDFVDLCEFTSQETSPL